MTITCTTTGQLVVHDAEAGVTQSIVRLTKAASLIKCLLMDSQLPLPVKHLYLGRYAQQFSILLQLAQAGRDVSAAITLMDATALYAIGLAKEPKLVQQAFFLGLAFLNPEYRHESAT